jgi:hypothetical protein
LESISEHRSASIGSLIAYQTMMHDEKRGLAQGAYQLNRGMEDEN